MLLEKVCNDSYRTVPNTDFFSNWCSLNTRQFNKTDDIPYETWVRASFQLVGLQTKNGRILNPSIFMVIRELEKNLGSFKPTRVRLFACDWRNNDVSV